MREPDADRTWVLGAPTWRLWTELDRFIAEDGIGIADVLTLIPPSVYVCQHTSCHEEFFPCLPRASGVLRKCARLAPLWCKDTLSEFLTGLN